MNQIKTSILNLSVNFTRLEIKSISEKLNLDPALIVGVVKEMVENLEVNGVYFSSTKSITFDQQSNIEDIERLKSKFDEIVIGDIL